MLYSNSKRLLKGNLYRTGICLMLVTACLLGAAHTMPVTAASPKGTLLILGDSIATGHSLSDYNSSGNPKSQYSWATLLSKEYGAKQVNLAVDGHTTSNLLEVVQNANNRNTVAQAKAICISIGGNNFLQLMGRLLSENTLFSPQAVESAYTPMQAAAEQDLDAIFTAIKQINPGAKVLVQTMLEPYQYFTVEIAPGQSIADWMGSYAARYNTALKTKAEAYGFTVVDVANAFRVNGQQSWLYASMSEGTPSEIVSALTQANPHPTADGHCGIFEAYRSTADSLLSEAFGKQDTAKTEATANGNTEDATEEAPSSDASSPENVQTNKRLAIILGGTAALAVTAGIGAFAYIKKKRHR